MDGKVTDFIRNRKYELLLLALVLHLFIGIILTDMEVYIRVIWPVNMVLLGLASVGVFLEKGQWKIYVRNVLFVIALLLPISLPFFGKYSVFMQGLSLLYTVYFAFIFWEIIRFLIRPSYINIDIISASACGYLLLIEVSVFLMQFLYYNNPQAFVNIEGANPALTYIDLVYFSSIIQTTIGFGDIAPKAHYTKLITALFGVIGQFYTVVLVGILISKFSATQQNSR